MTVPTIASDVTADTLADLLPPMHFLLRPGRHGERDRTHEPPTPEVRGQVRMMMTLQHAGRLTMNDLATAMNVTPPTVTGIVKRLVAQGDVVRIPDPDDGRTVRVELTDAGRARMDAHRAQHVAKLQHLLTQLDDDDQRSIGSALPALQRLLAVARSDDPIVDRLPAGREV